MTELKTTIDRLENERLSRNKDKESLEKVCTLRSSSINCHSIQDMIELEETLKRENDDLWQMVRDLQSEKKQLQERISSLAEQSVEEKEREGL